MLQTRQPELKIKIVVVGQSSTGKTNIKNRICNGFFSEFSNPTIGLQLSDRKFWSLFNNEEALYSMVCWDMGVNIHDQGVLQSYFRNALGVVYVYDITRKETFDALETWRETVIKFMNTQHYTEMVVGNKTDLPNFREVQTEQAQKWVILQRIELFYEVSALQNANIENSFQNFILSIINKFDDSIRQPIKLERKQAFHRGCL